MLPSDICQWYMAPLLSETQHWSEWALLFWGSKVGTGVILAAGSVIKGEAEDNCLYAGVPAIKKKEYPSRRIGEWGSNLYVDNGQKFKEAGLGQVIPEEFLMK